MISGDNLSRRVVITGIGVVSPLGIGVESFWQKLSAGQSGISAVELMSYSAAPGNIGGEVKEFTDQSARKTYLKSLRKSLKVMCREIKMGVASALLAVEDAALNLETIDHQRFGVDFGANLMFSPPEVLKDACWTCVETEEERQTFHYDRWGKAGGGPSDTTGMERMEPLWLLRYLPNMPACHIGIAVDARGPNNSITLDEASGNLALGEAARVIERGAAETMIAGTTGTRLHPVKTIHAALWDKLAEMSDPPETWCRPFDQSRNGQVLGEGACSFILEEESQARSRGANILGTILGFGSSCVSVREGKEKGQRLALANAMRAALRDAQLQPHEIGHLNANGLGTIEADRAEAAAIHDVFGDHTSDLPVTGLKSYFGNAGSGCGTLELAGSLLGLSHGVVPATRNYSIPDPQCPLNVVHGDCLSVTNRVAINVDVTRAGQASALIVAADHV